MPPSKYPEIERFLEAHPSVAMVEALITDCNGIARGKQIPAAKLSSTFDPGLKMPKSALALDIWGREVTELALENGDIDGYCVAVPSSLTPLLTPNGIDAAQVIMTMQDADGQPFMGDPRQVLQRVVNRFSAKGLRPCIAAELEFSLLIDPGPDRPLSDAVSVQDDIGGNLYALDALDQHQEMLDELRACFEVQRLPYEGIIKEYAPAQYEINMAHSADTMALADHVIQMQRSIFTTAARHGLIASFMPKPMSDVVGNGMHVHCSLLDEQGHNIFNDGTDQGSPLLRAGIAGCLHLMPESMLMFAPSFNAYRRFQPGNHAPTFPAWGYDNRTTALRIPEGPLAAIRIEHRVAGADANPYLAIAAVLMGILYGLENNLEAPPAIEGNAYDQEPEEPVLPTLMGQAIKRFKKSTIIADYMSADFQRMYTLAKQQELDEFNHRVTELELETYLR